VRPLVVQLTTDDQEKVAAALTVALTAAASGATVALWLSGPATMFAVPGQQPVYDLDYAPDLETALSSVSQIHVCSQCAARRGLTAGHLRPGADIAGAASLVEALLGDDTQGLIY
jgi:sulfur relay (sulfurtransferase) complex TusBCD TusD component (DsrE family)